MPTISRINSQTARFDPEAEFEHPRQVLEAVGLTLGQKVETLKRWEELVSRRLAATNEGMPPNGTTDDNVRLLEAIHAAQSALDDIPSGNA